MNIERLGPYLLGKRLGRGGMGTVFEAVHDSTGERAAVKVLNPQLALVEGFRERFESEIDSLKRLQHEGIVRLYGFGEDQGLLFYSMELVDGASLDEELGAQRRFHWRETLSIAIQVCKALKHAHDHGVVHRDIKPANLLLTAEERVKIADFGIARLFGASQLTSVGGVLGTADYMSPEQAEGKAITERTDQYSLGCVMYALLAGRPPFRAKSIPEMLQLQRYAEPEPVRRYAADVPVQLEQLIQQLLSKDPQARFPNVLVLARHMEAMSKALSRPVPREDPDDDPSLAWERGQSEATGSAYPDATVGHASPSALRAETSDSDVHNAPTLAEPVGAAGSRSAPGGSLTRHQPPAPARFTTVDEERAQRRAAQRPTRTAFVAQLAGLIGGVALVAALGWRLTRPPSADRLYETIAAAAEADSDGEGLRSASRELDEFVRRFPQDPRIPEIERYREQLQLVRRERQLRLRTRLSGDALHPAERLYGAALRLAETDPDRAAALLEALAALYADQPRGAADAPSAAGASPSWLLLAHRKLEELRAQAAAAAATQLPELRERLAVAERLRSEQPATARSIARALVTLYADKPWAADVVQKAQALAASLPTETPD